MKWEDASAAKVGDIHPGDQLRAKGDKNEDGTQLAAQEIVSGSFRNIAGLVTGVDAAQGTLTVQDLATKKPVTVKITADSQMKKLPVQVAQGIAMRLKGGAAAAQAAGARPRAGGDLNQMLGRLPTISLGELTKGEAIMMVSTMGSAAQPPVAITLLGGVEPTLQPLQPILPDTVVAGQRSGRRRGIANKNRGAHAVRGWRYRLIQVGGGSDKACREGS